MDTCRVVGMGMDVRRPSWTHGHGHGRSLSKPARDDPATWARLRVVPFNVVIPPAEQDTELSAKLELEADGILSWAVAGLRDYLERGLDDPRGVRVATAAYHRDSDALARFIDECCETGSAYQERTSELHAAWVGWQLRDGAEPMSMKAFGQAQLALVMTP